MKRLAASMADFLRDVLQTAFRLLPWPTEPGLRAVGKPGPFSPVLITGNYDLTVRRVLRAIGELDVWLVIAPYHSSPPSSSPRSVRNILVTGTPCAV